LGTIQKDAEPMQSKKHILERRLAVGFAVAMTLKAD
jgi:hypothetical protein